MPKEYVLYNKVVMRYSLIMNALKNVHLATPTSTQTKMQMKMKYLEFISFKITSTT